MKKLKEELANMKEQLSELSEMSDRLRKKPRLFHIDMGEKIHDYVGDIMEGVAEGISGELERSVFIGPHGVRVSRGRREENVVKTDPAKAASAMSALGNEYRLRILGELCTVDGISVNCKTNFLKSPLARFPAISTFLKRLV